MCALCKRWLIDFLRGEEGPTVVEYATMLALIIVVCLASITVVGSQANSTFTAVGNGLSS